MCSTYDRYREDILVHEFAHTLHLLGFSQFDQNFNQKLLNIYENAVKNGLWKDTYAIKDYQEYFATGIQCWFQVMDDPLFVDGIHNSITTRQELRSYDPELYNLISQYFVESTEKISCYGQ